MKQPNQQDFKVLVNYDLDGVSVTQSVYTGPHRNHALKAYNSASALINHGILTDCTLRFFDGYRLRADWEKRAKDAR